MLASNRWLWTGVVIVALATGCGESHDSGSGGTAGSTDVDGGSAGGTGGSGGTTPTGPTLDEVGDMFATAFCDVFEECLPEASAEQYFGPDGCIGRFGPTLEDMTLLSLQEAVDAGSVTYDPSMVDACFTAIGTLGCDDGVRVFEHEDCADVFVGSVAEGGDCSIDEECIGANFCDRTTGCPGTCTAPLAAGAECEDDEHCQGGLTCSDRTGECATQAATGQACGGGVAPDCNLGLICAGEDEDAGTAGTCKPNAEVLIGALGAVCDFDTGLLCQEGLTCAVTELSMARVTFECVASVASGAACNFGSPDMCPTDEHCSGLDLEQGDVEGTCAPLPVAGEPCMETYAGPCQPGLVCADGDICRAVARIGDACFGDETCASDNCDSGVCAAPETCAL